MVLICQLRGHLGLIAILRMTSLVFKVNLGYKPYTRREMLSLISKIYDPLGLSTKLSPFLLKGQKILQELCKNNFGWDEQVLAEDNTRMGAVEK